MNLSSMHVMHNNSRAILFSAHWIFWNSVPPTVWRSEFQSLKHSTPQIREFWYRAVAQGKLHWRNHSYIAGISLTNSDYFFFEASHLGTVVASVHAHTRMHPRTPHSYHTCTTRPTTRHRVEDRVLLEITETINGNITVPLWHHARGCRFLFGSKSC